MKLNVLIVVGLLLVSMNKACAGGYEFSLGYYTYTQSYDPGEKPYLQAKPGATDGFDGEAPISSNHPPIRAGFHKKVGIDGWNGPTGFYINDFRAPLAPGGRMIFDIYVWASETTQPQHLYFAESGALSDLSPDLMYKLQLISIPTGVTYDGPMEWGREPHPDIKLPFYSTTDGLTGYRFRVEITAVPEPSSLLVLAGGLVGVGGLVLRRRGS